VLMTNIAPRTKADTNRFMWSSQGKNALNP